MRKLISFAVPCYNSAAYMRSCLNSLLTGGDEVEIIVINDGSTDGTQEIAEEYARNYPSIVRVINKENGGHGSGVNRGLQEAVGLYYKVVDSDDWVDSGALQTLLAAIRRHTEENTLPDLYITNFVYEHASDNTFYVSRYTDKLPVEKLCGWKMKKFRYSRMLLMHALVYNREKLLASHTVLPEHTFYVDNLFAYQPLPYMKTVYYLDIDLYRYFIGRSDQSVNVANIIQRYEQQIRVMRAMADAYSYRELRRMPKGLRRYMMHALEVNMVNTMFFTFAQYTEKRRQDIKSMWAHIKKTDARLYRRLRYCSYPFLVYFLPWKVRGKVLRKGYDFLCKKVKLG